jgi:hypothetical protein
MTMSQRTWRAGALSLPLVAVAASGCFIDASDDTTDGDRGTTRIETPADTIPAGLRDTAQTCELEGAGAAGTPTWYCFETEEYQWRTSCRSDGCQQVKVFTHYMLPDELDGHYAVNVEAFDNPAFQGAPVGSVRLADFAARRGSWKESELYLEPGEYYLRAYMTDADAGDVPYVLGGMTLVADRPVGVFGALSGAEMVRVAPRAQARHPDPVHIYLDKLFKKAGSEPETNAHLRVALAAAEGVEVPDGRQIHVQLRKTSDMAEAPVYDFTMASEALLVQGRLGRAEFVSPSLALGPYVVSAFVDDNGNGLLDAGEPAAVHRVDGLAQALQIAANRTETIALTLAGPTGPAAGE